MEPIVFLQLMTGIILTCVGQEPTTMDIHIDDGSDFAEIVKTTLFMDKSLLIKRFFDLTKRGSGLLILAPRHYGKSTNLDMVRRFCELNMDEDGELIDSEKTTNYKIFSEKYLDIFKIRDFFNKNFGKHPVIFIDYKPLSQVTSVELMLAVYFKKVMVESFTRNQYLLNDTFLWSLNQTHSWISKEKFEMFLHPEFNEKLTEKDIQTGFSFLSRLLHIRFEKGVVVLIDNYDAFVESPLFSEKPEIHHLISSVNADLLRSESVERSLITGRIRSGGPSIDHGKILPANIDICRSEHGVWAFYGISVMELDRLLESMVYDNDERERVMAKIVHDHSGYSVATLEVGENPDGQMLDTQTCSVWSVIQFFQKELNVENFSSLV